MWGSDRSWKLASSSQGSGFRVSSTSYLFFPLASFWISRPGRACAYRMLFKLLSAILCLLCISRFDSVLTLCVPFPSILKFESHCGRKGWP